MPSKTRGSIEEGSIIFSNETEKTIVFKVVATQAKRFNSTPVVSVISVGATNVGVTFTDITLTGMKVQTSAPFTGTIRYLCSVQG
jgi:hypothetical protein